MDADLAVRNCEVIVETAMEIERTFRPDAFGIEVNQFQQLLADIFSARAREAGLAIAVRP